ncbi:hypothetical protein GCM10009530_09130 [Microbispora corallina]|uniref:Secreted protein n=1 Tax=Microbispora corallina TaxID=83302 RepID=A0ABQ4FVM0_9ACTN|nr:hypothetical protein Mco01_18760 [Microbispora corallina]
MRPVEPPFTEMVVVAAWAAGAVITTAPAPVTAAATVAIMMRTHFLSPTGRRLRMPDLRGCPCGGMSDGRFTGPAGFGAVGPGMLGSIPFVTLSVGSRLKMSEHLGTVKTWSGGKGDV